MKTKPLLNKQTTGHSSKVALVCGLCASWTVCECTCPLTVSIKAGIVHYLSLQTYLHSIMEIIQIHVYFKYKTIVLKFPQYCEMCLEVQQLHSIFTCIGVLLIVHFDQLHVFLI